MRAALASHGNLRRMRRGFSPLHINGCALWIDAQRIAPGAIASCTNFGARGGAFVQTVPSARPSNVEGAGPNGNAIVFSGSSFLTSTTNASSWTFLHEKHFSLFVVFRGNASASGSFSSLLATYDGSVTQRGFIVGWDNRTAYARSNCIALSIANGTSAYVYSTASANETSPSNTWQLIEVHHDFGSSSSDLLALINGTSAIQTEPNGVPSNNAPAQTLHFGTITPNAGLLHGAVAELCAFDRTLSLAERSYVRGGMIEKHTLRL